MDKVQSLTKSGNVSSSTDTEMHTFSNRKQKVRHRPPATAHSEDMEELRVASTEFPKTTSFNSPNFSVLSSLHRGRSYERLTTAHADSIFQEQTGYLSDSSLPSERQSIARRQDFPHESNETTPLIQQHSPTASIEGMEKVIDEDNETVSFSSSKHAQKQRLLVRIRKHSKVIILFLIMLASVVSSGNSN